MAHGERVGLLLLEFTCAPLSLATRRYGRSCGFGLSPTASVVLVMATFVVASFSNGFFTVSLSAECQNICGFKAKHTCPVIGALVWQAMQLGCVLGFVASYVTAPLIEPHACAF